MMEAVTATQMIGGNPKQRRSETDFYPTPQEVTQALLDFLKLPQNTTIWECACGEFDMANTLQSNGFTVIATDIIYGEDFLTTPFHECDWIITNPPFSVSDKFIERCAEHGKPFALLLKSQYWHAKKRHKLFLRYPPMAVCPLTWRPDFLFKKRKKGAPLMDVMWCIWRPPYYHETTYHPLSRKEAKK